MPEIKGNFENQFASVTFTADWKTFGESPVFDGRSEVTPLLPDYAGDFFITAFSVTRAVLPCGDVALPDQGQSPVKWVQWFSNDLLPESSQTIQYGYFKLVQWCRLVNSLLGGRGLTCFARPLPSRFFNTAILVL